MDYNIIIYITFGMLPSLVWLSYYLRKDVHPEPKKAIIKIFLWGAFITLPIFFIQIGFKCLLDELTLEPLAYNLIYWFLIISFSEEFFKYMVIRIKIIYSPYLDEPLDIMLYMVIAALGFSALENILYLLAPAGQLSLEQIIVRTLIIDFIRFIGATFLHTLCSALIGYFLALSFCCAKKTSFLYLPFGILIATFLHGIYNFSIITLEGYFKFGIPAIVILSLAFFVFLGFEKLKKMKGICKLK